MSATDRLPGLADLTGLAPSLSTAAGLVLLAVVGMVVYATVKGGR